MDEIKVNKVDNEHLTIAEIKHCEKASKICHKVGVAGAIMSGLSFLLACVNVGVIEMMTSPVLRTLIGLSSLGLIVFGCVGIEYSREALITSEDINEKLDRERDYIYHQGK